VRTLPLILLLTACPPSADTDTGSVGSTDETDVDTDETDTDDTDTGDTDPPHAREVFRLQPPVESDGVHTATHQVCANCHTASPDATALKDAAGRAVGPADLWPASVMAHSARDPLFLAAVAREKAQTPDLAGAIEEKCLSCHAPAAWADRTLAGEDAPRLDVLTAESALGDLARDGATCVGCHLQEPDLLGDPSTFSGNHDLNADRVIYGPHRAPFAGPMRNFADFEPTEAPHIAQSAVCASCHTLLIDAVDSTGTPTGHTSLEQGPFLEWQSSAYYPPRGEPQARQCQTCHMPMTDVDGVPIKTRIARNPTGSDFPRTYEREPVSRHVLYGGNTFVLGLIRDHRELLGSPATEQALDASIEGTRGMLATAATVSTGTPSWDDDTVTVPITVQNTTGHKLPTGYPSRRAWLEVEVRDHEGEVVWHVGAVDARGRLVDDDGSPVPSELDSSVYLPHIDQITESEQVLVWESVLSDANGAPTTTLLRAASYAKDNRLLPTGWDPVEAWRDELAPIGVSADDDFVGGGDTVQVRFEPEGEGPWTLTARVRYQAFQPAHLGDLVSADTPESRGLREMIGDRGVPAEVIAEQTLSFDHE